MEQEKINEIKKALKYNVLDEFMNRLPYGDGFNKLKMVSFEDILAYINELESENKRLKQSNKNILFVNEKVIERNKNLKEKLLSDVRYEIIDSVESSIVPIATKEEIIKEFAKWLCERSNNMIYEKLAKEFINESI